MTVLHAVIYKPLAINFLDLATWLNSIDIEYLFFTATGLSGLILLLAGLLLLFSKRDIERAWLLSWAVSATFVLVYSIACHANSIQPESWMALLPLWGIVEGLLAWALAPKGVVSFREKSRMGGYGLVFAIFVAGIYVAAVSYDVRSFQLAALPQAVLIVLVARLGLSPAILRRSEAALLRLVPSAAWRLWLHGQAAERLPHGFLQQVQACKTIVFPHKHFLTDSNPVIQDVNHRSTLLEQTVLNTFYQLFQHLDPQMAQMVRERMAVETPIVFSSVECRDAAVYSTDNFGVRYTLGPYTSAREFTQDASYSYYLTRGTTLFAKMLVSDSPLVEQRQWILEFNRRPMNTVLLSGESAPACYQTANFFELDKEYGNRNESEQIELLKQLSARAPVAAIAYRQEWCAQVAVAFAIEQGDSAAQARAVWRVFAAAKLLRGLLGNWALALVALALVAAVLQAVYAFAGLWVLAVPLLLSLALQVVLPSIARFLFSEKDKA